MLSELIKRIQGEHVWHPPSPNAAEEIRQFESQIGFVLPDDVRQFYLCCGGAELFADRNRIIALPNWTSANRAMVGDDTQDYCPKRWQVFCDRLDGDWVGIDLGSVGGSAADILDCDHEDIGSCKIIARSFTEFLQRLLDSDGGLWWHGADQPDYGRVKYESPPSYYKRHFSAWYQSLGDESGTEKCSTPGCHRRRISQSVKCRSHHFEMVIGAPCPTEMDETTS